jgi:energy-coupling factor transport system permease protein
LIMMMQVALRFLPLLALTAERTAKAQASRGADWDTSKGGLFKSVRRVVPLILPLFLASLQKAENMSQAMDSRAYGVVKIRSAMKEMKFKWVDGLVAIAILAICAAIIFV